MLVLLTLVLAGLAAAYFTTRDDKSSKSATVTTTLAQIVAPPRPQTTGPKPAAAPQAAVPKLVGTPAPVALQTLNKLGLSGTTRGVFSTKPRNRVVSQKPGAGTTLAKGAGARKVRSRLSRRAVGIRGAETCAPLYWHPESPSTRCQSTFV
jgi:hypothetical protein